MGKWRGSFSSVAGAVFCRGKEVKCIFFTFKNVHFGCEAPKYKRETGDLIIASHFLISQIFILCRMLCSEWNTKGQPLSLKDLIACKYRNSFNSGSG